MSVKEPAKDDKRMTFRSWIGRMAAHDRLNFILTNYIPRRTATRFVGWLSRIEQPQVRDASIGIWRMFSDLDLSEARTKHFRSLRDRFIRELKEGARPIDLRPDILASPSDGIVGACGVIEDGAMLQVKGSAYTLADLVRDEALVATYRDGRYVTLRLTASMYHRFHAPHDCTVTGVSHIAGDTCNVNPPTLKRVPRVFCRNERAILRLVMSGSGFQIVLVPVAAILVAGIRLNFAELPIDRDHRHRWSAPCDATLAKGAEMGWFEHGPTIIVLAPPGFEPCEGVVEGCNIRMGEPLMRVPG